MDENVEEQSQIIFYTGEDGAVHVGVFYAEENLWLTQKQMAELFGVDVRTVSEHLRNIFDSNELDEQSVIRKFRITAADGKKYNTNVYHLDAIISIGYRVNSYQATQFRIWATRTLREFIQKGFVLDDERLKKGTSWGKDYFDELLERIREIRASERRFYQKITDIYAQCSVDYSSDSEITKKFYAQVQNKLHWAVVGKTAAEIVYDRVDSTMPNMGLKTWKQAPDGKVLKSNVSIAKNYLEENELKMLNRIVGMFLDYAEDQAARKRTMNMQDWSRKLDSFLAFNEYDILHNTGKVNASVAKDLAEAEFEKYRVIQDENYESDFDRLVRSSKEIE